MSSGARCQLAFCSPGPTFESHPRCFQLEPPAETKLNFCNFCNLCKLKSKLKSGRARGADRAAMSESMVAVVDE